MAERQSWLAVVQHGDGEHEQDTELVTLEGLEATAGGVIELTDGQRITLLEPADAVHEAA